MKRITVSKNYTSYNGRRYGKPWCARIKSFNGSATLEFENSKLKRRKHASPLN